MDYDNFTNSNHLDWFDTGPWYNTNICSKLHVITFEDFITHARTDWYNITCSLVAHDRLQPDYKDDESSIGDRSIPNDAILKELKSLGATFNFIDIWLHFFRENYFARSESYSISMKEMFIQIPQNVEKPLTSREKNQKLMTDIGGGWCLKKCERGLPLLKRTKLSKKAQERHDFIFKKILI